MEFINILYCKTVRNGYWKPWSEVCDKSREGVGA